MTLDRPTVPERYGHAMDSSHLTLTPDRLGDVDVLISAGWIRDGLGTALYRLMHEFDAVRGEHRLAYENLRSAERAARRVIDESSGQKLEHLLSLVADGVQREDLASDAAKRIKGAKAELNAARITARSAKALILVQLKTLSRAKLALASYAIGQATRQRYMQDNDHVVRIAGAALSAWMDPICNACSGRGFNDGYLKPKILCTECSATGRQRVSLDGSDAGHAFGRFLLVQMDRKTERVSEAMKRFWSREGGERGKSAIASIEDLRTRLLGMRSRAAEND